MTDAEIPEEIARRLRPLGESPVPAANPALAAFLADPGSPVLDQGDLPAAAAKAPSRPKRRHTMKNILGDLLGAVARLGLVGKVALGTAAIAVAGMGSAAAVGAVVDDTSPSVPVVQTVDESEDAGVGTPKAEPSDDANDPADSSKSDDQGDDSSSYGGSGSSTSDDQGDDSDEDSDHQGSTSTDDQGDDSDEDSDHQGSTSTDDQGDDSDDDSDHQGGSDSSDD